MNWMISRTFLITIVFSVLLSIINCGGSNDQQNSHFQRGSGNGFPGINEPTVPVAVEEADLGEIASYYTATATLSAEKEAQILTRVAGVVENITSEEGDRVTKGQELLTIDDEEYRLRLKQAEANVIDLRSRFERLEALKDQKMASIEEYEGVKNDLKIAEAEEGLARLTLSYTKVTAPFSGIIVSRDVDSGQNVNVGTILFRLADFDPLLARVHVPSKEFNKLKQNQPVTLVLESNQQQLEGRIKLISPVIDPSSGTIKVTVEIEEYPQSVRPGDFTEVRIMTERRMERVLVPNIAIVNQRGERVVFVVNDGIAESRIVETGFQDDDNTEIISGVKQGELVVVKGQRLLKHGSPVKILEGEPAEQSKESKHPSNDKDEEKSETLEEKKGETQRTFDPDKKHRREGRRSKPGNKSNTRKTP